jgi:hypothetical protein
VRIGTVGGLGQARGMKAPFRVEVPPLRNQVGLGELLSRLISSIGIRPCASCARRSAQLDAAVTFGPPHPRKSDASYLHRWTDANGAWHFDGACTGFGNRSCVNAPSSQTDPGAPAINQCCGGWFQYPWIVVPRSGQASSGCGACLF